MTLAALGNARDVALHFGHGLVEFGLGVTVLHLFVHRHEAFHLFDIALRIGGGTLDH
ncbi:hypothetical protein D3C71_2185740 [compost metagenome]